MDTDIIELNEKNVISEGDFDASSLSLTRTQRRSTRKPYVLYCIMTLSVMLLSLAFAASELFSMFFSEEYLGGMFMSKLFGADAVSDMGIKEILLKQSFCDLSYWNDSSDNAPSKEENGSDGSSNLSNNGGSIGGAFLPSEDDSSKPTEDLPPKENIYDYDLDNIPEGMSGIIPMDLSLSEYGLDYVYNQSSVSFDIEKLKSIDVSTDTSGIYPSGYPLVLIVHTHGTEAFSPDGIGYYDPSKEVARSGDTESNVVSLGEIVAKILNENGIPTVHCDIMHDAKGYTGAYDRSAEAIKEYLDRYPSIRYVIDIHRDAVVRSSGELVRPVVQTDEGASAQIMFVVGTGVNSEKCAGWEGNLALAQRVRGELNSKIGNICRPTCLRDSSYNQYLSAYSMLIEIGAAGNTHGEAVLAAKTAAKALAAVIKGE